MNRTARSCIRKTKSQITRITLFDLVSERNASGRTNVVVCTHSLRITELCGQLCCVVPMLRATHCNFTLAMAFTQSLPHRINATVQCAHFTCTLTHTRTHTQTHHHHIKMMLWRIERIVMQSDGGGRANFVHRLRSILSDRPMRPVN